MKKQTNYILISAIACIIACIGEFVALFVLGLYYPGFNHLEDTMSSLGASVSPVAGIISFWWIIMGVFLIFFATGLKKAFPLNKKYTITASMLIILYALGEGIGSGTFRADHIETGLTNSAIVHDILGAIGVTAILLLPLPMQKVITKIENPLFVRISKFVFVTGIATVFLFLFRYSSDDTNFLAHYKGLWQRLFMLNTYMYLTIIAVLMIKKDKNSK